MKTSAWPQPRGACGYADLLLGYAVGGRQGLAAMAALTGYQPGPRRVREDRPTAQPTPPAAAPPEFIERPRAELPVWQPTERVFLNSVAEPPPSPPSPPPPDWDKPAAHTDLAPWNALLPWMRAAAAARMAGKAPDIAALLRRVGKGALLDHLPRRLRRRWGAGVQIITDRGERLVPFYEDQARLESRLVGLFPGHGVERGTAFDGFDDPVLTNRRGDPAPYRPPPPGTLVLVLGDLGCLAGNPDRLVARWIAFGRRLAAAGCRAVAVTPCPRARWRPGLARWWTMVEWDRRAASPSDPAALTGRTERLLTLASPAIRLEPTLLRDIRRLLGPAADAGTEADLWQHRALTGRSSVAGTLDPDIAVKRRAVFHQQERELAPAVAEALRRHRAGLAREIWMEELLRFDPALLPAAIRDRDLHWARRHATDVLPTLADHAGGLAYGRRLGRRGLADVHGQEDPALCAALSRMYAEAFPDPADRPPPPPGFHPRLLGDGGQPERSVELRQIGGDLVLQAPGDGPGSPLTTLRTANGEIQLLEEDAFWKSGKRPSWALDWGRDEFGAWVTFGIEDVIQRLRWIPPGRFLMGSPEGEPGRWDDEGPQHEVTLSRGCWLFDTACTQALWHAVMGENPSHFTGDDRHPVDSVSWEDVQGFLTRLNDRVPGLDLGLPTEAQWEYACRAGTTTPFSFGATITPEQVNYNGNRPYAGRALGLYRKRTVPVGNLPPNPWGLYEMHGNLWEWCADAWGESTAQSKTDPRGPDRAGAGRVLRGGSWDYDARFARAACRHWDRPDDRNFYIGFRCARVQAVSQASPEDAAEPTAPALPRLAERRGTQGAAGGAVLRVEFGTGGGARCPLPQAPAFHIRTDREELLVERITQPAWADALGRDRFGLWTAITVEPEDGGPPVTQRLRWIPPGRFLMGSPDDEPGRDDDEGPQHLVTLSRGYWLFDTACPQALWRAVMGENPSRFKDDDRLPVDSVSWQDVQGFLSRINARVPGLDVSLPTEAQWEHACRAGTATPFSFGATITPEQVNYDGNYPYAGGAKGLYRKRTVPVGSLPPNPWGLHEMHGNVLEWCADGRRDYTAQPGTDPRGPESTGAERVLRGGSWSDLARFARAASRFRLLPDARYVIVGFRCARVQAWQASQGEAAAGLPLGRPKRSAGLPGGESADAGRREDQGPPQGSRRKRRIVF